MSDKRHPNVVNIEEAAAREEARGKFVYRTRTLGREAGGRALGCSWYELSPGKTTFPFHWHSALEEALYILEGAGTLRIGADTVEVRAGDYIAFPVGPEHAHQLTNSGAAPLRYLALSGPSTPATMEIVGYPDSKKLAFRSGVDAKSGPRGGAWTAKLIKDDVPNAGYYDDEPLANE